MNNRPIKIAIATVVVLILSYCYHYYHLGSASLPEVDTIPANDVAARIVNTQGTRVVLLYAAYCPSSRKLFPEFINLAEEYQARGVAILAFSADESLTRLRRYLSDFVLPFDTVRIEPWASGELGRAMRPTGIEIGATWGTPLVAVIDRNGDVRYQHSGSSSIPKVREWLDYLEARDRR
jgi:thiol-disulfide isomerase/thioredoxin